MNGKKAKQLRTGLPYRHTIYDKLNRHVKSFVIPSKTVFDPVQGKNVFIKPEVIKIPVEQTKLNINCGKYAYKRRKRLYTKGCDLPVLQKRKLEQKVL